MQYLICAITAHCVVRTELFCASSEWGGVYFPTLSSVLFNSATNLKIDSAVYFWRSDILCCKSRLILRVLRRGGNYSHAHCISFHSTANITVVSGSGWWRFDIFCCKNRLYMPFQLRVQQRLGFRSWFALHSPIYVPIIHSLVLDC